MDAVEHRGIMKENKADITKKIKDQKYIQKLKEQGIRTVTIKDDNYPKKLMPFESKPEILFYKGNLPDENVPSVAIIGARACSNYGRVNATKIGELLSMRGVQVISGLARGIDTYAALGALKGNTPTFAILGSGVDICYPTENIELYESIIKAGGGIISEYPPGTKPYAWNFPKRNRIISGLSDGIVVIEAKENSGSLITVEWALEQGKDIFAVPGKITDQLSIGCNRLIKNGAAIICKPEDVLEELNISFENENKNSQIIDDELRCVYDALSYQPINIEEILSITGLTYSEVINSLIKLQLLKVIEQPFDNYFSKK